MNCKLIRYATIFSLLFLSTSAYADVIHKFVVYDCDKEKDLINIKYIVEYNEEGEAIEKNKDENTINPWDLIETAISQGRGVISGIKRVVKKCRLSGGNYYVTISPVPGNWDLLGQCGVHISAWVSIKKEDKEIYSGGFEGRCLDEYDLDAMMPREITVIGKTEEILIKKGVQGDL